MYKHALGQLASHGRAGLAHGVLYREAMSSPPPQALPCSLAHEFAQCAFAAERCFGAFSGIEGLEEVTQKAYQCATLCRAAASLVATEALLAPEIARLAIASALICEETCAMQTEQLCAACVEACRSCVTYYRKAANGGPAQAAY